MVKLAGPLDTGRVVKNLTDGSINPSTSAWTDAEIGDGTVVVDGSDDRIVTFNAISSGDRAFLSRQLSVVSGVSYAIRFTVSDKVSTFSRENVDILGAIASGIEVNNIGEGERGVVVTANASTTITWRLGIGIDGADSGTLPLSWTISNVQIEALPAGQTVPSELVNVEQTNRDTVGFAEDVNSTLAAPGSGALLTDSFGDNYSFVTDFGVSFLADSFGDEPDEFIRLFETDNPTKFVNATSVGGSKLTSLTTADIDAVITQGLNYNVNAVQSGTLAIERIVNDIISDVTAVTALAHMLTLTNYAESIGLGCVVFTCPPFGNNASHTAGRETQALAYNSGLVTQYSGNDNVIVYDMFTTLEDSGTFNLAAGLDSGDGLHPNGTGAQDIADDFEVVRATLRAGVVTTLDSTGVGSRSIIGSFIG